MTAHMGNLRNSISHFGPWQLSYILLRGSTFCAVLKKKRSDLGPRGKALSLFSSDPTQCLRMWHGTWTSFRGKEHLNCVLQDAQELERLETVAKCRLCGSEEPWAAEIEGWRPHWLFSMGWLEAQSSCVLSGTIALMSVCNRTSQGCS